MDIRVSKCVSKLQRTVVSQTMWNGYHCRTDEADVIVITKQGLA